MRRGGARAAATLPLVVLALAGCGSPQEQYCDAVEGHQEELTRVADQGGDTAVLRLLPIYEDLHAEAPEDVQRDWGLVVARIQALQEAMDRADVDPASYDPEKPPEQASLREQQAIESAARALGAPEVAEAMSSVEQHARDVCKTELGGAPTGA